MTLFVEEYDSKLEIKLKWCTATPTRRHFSSIWQLCYYVERKLYIYTHINAGRFVGKLPYNKKMRPLRHERELEKCTTLKTSRLVDGLFNAQFSFMPLGSNTIKIPCIHKSAMRWQLPVFDFIGVNFPWSGERNRVGTRKTVCAHARSYTNPIKSLSVRCFV